MGVDGVPVVVNDLSRARFDVRVTIGPSYSTKRMETADAMLQFMQAVPAAAQVAPDLIAKALDFPGAEEVAKRLRNTIPPAILADPDDPNSQPPPPPNPMDDPAFRVEANLKNAQARKAMADARKVEMETTAMFAQPMMMPEPPLPPLEQSIAPPQPMGGPEMGMPDEMPMDGMPPDGAMPDMDPDQVQALLGGLPPGPSEPVAF
jgi:hypothetical protein